MLTRERVVILLVLLLGLVQGWVGRYSMQPDGIGYLDVGDSFFRHNWPIAVNGWWSPMYPWTLGLVIGIVRPSPRWEFPLVHLVNFGFFVFALLAFRFLLHSLLAWMRRRGSDNSGEALPSPVFILLAYSIFLWVTLELITLYEVSPDLLVLAFYCLSAGILLRLPQHRRIRNFVIFGVVLGLGYWAKTIMFPLGIATLGTSYLWKRSSLEWRRSVLVASIAFACTCLPFILLLSHQKGRFTFGDSAKINFAWSMSPRTFHRNWQGDIPDSGKPAHTTRRLLEHPPVYEFDGPVGGTYPPRTDPSYWNEGIQWHLKLKPLLGAFLETAPAEMRILLRSRPELVTCVAVLALLSGSAWLTELVELWPPIILSILGMGLYLPLVVNDRYLAGYVLVLFLLLLGAVRLRPDFQKPAFYVVLVAFVVMMISTGDYTVRIVTNHLAIPGVGPNSTWKDVVAAEELQKMGFHAGDKVGVIGDGTAAYWARLGKFRVVAEIMDLDRGSEEFWKAPAVVQERVYQTFNKTGAKVVVSRYPSCPSQSMEGWQQITGTQYYVYPLN